MHKSPENIPDSTAIGTSLDLGVDYQAPSVSLDKIRPIDLSKHPLLTERLIGEPNNVGIEQLHELADELLEACGEETTVNNM